MERVDRVVLVGFSGTGKSTVAGLVAARLGWGMVDTDAAVEAGLGMTVPEAFRERGEAAFRAEEWAVLGRALRRERIVVACGGGAAVDPAVWGADLLGRPGTLVVALDARPETSLRRLAAQQAVEGRAVERPLLATDDRLGRISALKASRQRTYDAAHLSVIVDEVAAEAVAEEIVGVVSRGAGGALELRLDAPSGASEIQIGPGVAGRVGHLIRARWPTVRRAWVAADATVAALHGEAVRAALESAGVPSAMTEVAPGEGSKSLQGVGRLYDWLLDGGIERGDAIVALGGGVVGDLAGFVAATTLRGVGLAQVPTTLLAMVDSSVGGKTGINHRAGKNLIGAFYQPPVVAIDPLLLRTLPARELTSGWAEVVKHAIIQPSTPGGERADLATFLERNAGRLLALDEPATSYLIGRNVALKGAVVEADEREAGVRAYLNFGHTLGHAIEAAGYRLLHGEAVAVGMRAAARIGGAVGTCGAEEVGAIDALLDRFGLPTRAGVDPDVVVSLLGSDKKRAAGRQRWVLPVRGGGVTIRDDVPEAVVRAALAAVSQPVAAGTSV